MTVSLAELLLSSSDLADVTRQAFVILARDASRFNSVFSAPVLFSGLFSALFSGYPSPRRMSLKISVVVSPQPWKLGVLSHG